MPYINAALLDSDCLTSRLQENIFIYRMLPFGDYSLFYSLLNENMINSFPGNCFSLLMN